MKIRGTTIVAVRHRGKVVVAGDGQVTVDMTVMKHGARKVRRLYHVEVVVGFAGHGGCFHLFERFVRSSKQFTGKPPPGAGMTRLADDGCSGIWRP